MYRRVLACVLVLTGAGHADPMWPVRLNVTMPLGYTFGSDRVHGFTWGFRGSATVHPSDHGVAIGGFAEMLLDARTRHFSTFGLVGSAPVHVFDLDGELDPEFRVGGYAGARFTEGDDRTRIAAGLTGQLTMPAYLYEARIGLRIDGTFDGASLTSTSLLVDLDLLALIGAAAWAMGSK